MPFALVTGASRGVGRGTATALADAGYTVFATGRSIAGAALPDAVIRIPCDHTHDEETDAAFRVVGTFTDLKSYWLRGHAEGTSQLAEAAAWRLGLPEDEVQAI